MEKSDAVRMYNDSKLYLKLYLKEINKNDVNTYVFTGKVSLKIRDVAENLNILAQYINDGKNGARKLKTEIAKLKESAAELRKKTKEKGFVNFSNDCKSNIDNINLII